MTLEIRSFTLGIVSTHAYLLADQATGNALLIDPVDQAPLLIQAAQDEGWKIKLILATHAHFDHVLASKELKEKTGAPFYIHHEAAPWLDNLPDTGVRFTGEAFPPAAKPDRLLTTESEIIEFESLKIHTLYTPGHAPGHLSYYLPDYKIVFSGDALFAGGIGRTDLPGSNYEQLMQSIFTQLMSLDDDIRVFPGHGPDTTIGKERRSNPFLLDYNRKNK